MRRSLPFLRRSLRITGSQRSALDVARGRMVFLSICFAVGYMLVGARVVDLTIIQGELPRYAQSSMQDIARPDEAVTQTARVRADIVDRNGVLLATSLETASLYADPSMIPDPELVARQLAETLPGLSYGDALQRLQRRGRFVWIRRNLTPDEQYAVLRLGHPGLNFRTEYSRLYPQGPLAAHMVGYADIDGNGLSGVERSFNGLLNEGGRPLSLSIDIRLQHVLRREAMAAMKSFDGIAAAGLIMDVASGEILAAVSLPDFDPHSPGNPADPALMNRVTQGVYELGSTFKIFSTAALIELFNPGMEMTFDAREPLKRGRHTISDFHPQKRVLTLPESFMHSSNIGSALMAEKVGTDALRDFYADLGLMNPASLEIGEIGTPILPRPWREINTLTASYGHGIAVSPLQLVVAASSIAGGGTVVQPTLIKNQTGIRMTGNRTDVRVVSPQTAHRMRQLMRLAVTDGTAKSADIPGYRVGGKTGTATKNVGGRYDRSKRISNFVAFFPMEAPRYAVFIMVDEPKGTRESFGFATGGWVAAPAVGRVIAGMAPLVGMPPQQIAPQDELSAGLKRFIRSDKNGEGHLAAY